MELEQARIQETDRIQALLQGTIVRYPTRYAGLGKVQCCSPETLQLLLQYPGVQALTKVPKPVDQGYYVPSNLFNVGLRRGPAMAYDPEPINHTPSNLKLDDHQLRLITACRSVDRESAGIIVGCDVGLGKTMISLQSLWLDGFLQKKGLVIGPLAAADTWCSEKGDPWKHYGLKIKPLTSSTADVRELYGADWFFIHFDIVEYWQAVIFANLQPASIVIDEIHNLCNTKSRRHQSVRALSFCNSIVRRIGLTGTPIPKDRMDLYGELEILQPNQWGTYVDFGVRYSNGHREALTEEKSFWVFDAETRTEELRARLAGTYLRLTKQDIVDSVLPKLIREPINIELNPEVRAEYQKAKADIVRFREERRLGQPLPTKIRIGSMDYDMPRDKLAGAPLVITTTLKSILDKGKIAKASSVVKDLMAKHRKLVVFTWQIDAAKLLVKELKPHFEKAHVGLFGPITGNITDLEKRIAIATEFAQCSAPAVIVATRGSAGVSINVLNCADAVLQVTPDWNPDGNIQAEGRVHRKGNTYPEVHSYYMLAPKTLDDRVLELIRTKAECARSLSDQDEDGLNLACELDPTGTMDEQWSLDALCAALAGVSED
jgi:SNF2 family DNA or RNA helicase